MKKSDNLRFFATLIAGQMDRVSLAADLHLEDKKAFPASSADRDDMAGIKTGAWLAARAAERLATRHGYRKQQAGGAQ